MRLQAALRGDLRAMMERDLAAASGAIHRAVREGTDDLKREFRAEASRGLRLRRGANFIRGEFYDNGALSAAGVVYSAWRRKARGGTVSKLGANDVLAAHETGATIVPANGRWLFIPFPGVPRRFRRGVSMLSRYRNLSFVRRADGSFLVFEAGRKRSKPLGLLVRQVRLRPRLAFAPIEQRAQARLPARLMAAWRA